MISKTCTENIKKSNPQTVTEKNPLICKVIPIVDLKCNRKELLSVLIRSYYLPLISAVLSFLPRSV